MSSPVDSLVSTPSDSDNTTADDPDCRAINGDATDGPHTATNNDGIDTVDNALVARPDDVATCVGSNTPDVSSICKPDLVPTMEPDDKSSTCNLGGVVTEKSDDGSVCKSEGVTSSDEPSNASICESNGILSSKPVDSSDCKPTMSKSDNSEPTGVPTTKPDDSSTCDSNCIISSKSDDIFMCEPRHSVANTKSDDSSDCKTNDADANNSVEQSKTGTSPHRKPNDADANNSVEQSKTGTSPHRKPSDADANNSVDQSKTGTSPHRKPSDADANNSVDQSKTGTSLHRKPNDCATNAIPTRQRTRGKRSCSSDPPMVTTRQTRRKTSGSRGRKPAAEEDNKELTTGGTSNGKVAVKGAEVVSRRRSPRKLKHTVNIEEEAVGPVAETVDCKTDSAAVPGNKNTAKAVTRTRKRKIKEPEKDTTTTAGDAAVESTAAVVQKSPTVDAATSPFVKTAAVRRRKTSTAQTKVKRTRNARRRGKRKKRDPLPTFDDDDDDDGDGEDDSTMEKSVETECKEPASTRNLDSASEMSKQQSSVEEDNPSVNRPTMEDSLGASYNDDNTDDLDSNQSSDEDLPDVLSQESKKIVEEDMIWAKIRNFPYWPAVVKKLYKNKGKATVLFAGELNKSNQKGKGVAIRTLKPYLCAEKDNLIDQGLKHPKVLKEEFKDAVDKAEDYITKRGLGKTKGLTFFTTEDYSSYCDESPLSTTALSITCSPPMMAGLPLDQGATTSPLTPPCDYPFNSGMDSPRWKTGLSPDEKVSDSIEMEEESDGSEVDEELEEKRSVLSKLQERLMRYILKRPLVKEHLLKIYHGHVKSKRHTLYFTPGPEAKYSLEKMRGFGPITDDEKQDELMKFLRNLYIQNCVKDRDGDVVFTSMTTTYLTDVWFPEAIIFALHKTHRIGLKRAEQTFFSEEKKAMELTSDLDDNLKYLTKEEREELIEKSVRRAARQLGLSPREFGLS